jgi:hypothetical protein
MNSIPIVSLLVRICVNEVRSDRTLREPYLFRRVGEPPGARILDHEGDDRGALAPARSPEEKIDIRKYRHRSDAYSEIKQCEPAFRAAFVDQVLDPRNLSTPHDWSVRLQPCEKRHDLVQLSEAKT